MSAEFNKNPNQSEQEEASLQHIKNMLLELGTYDQHILSSIFSELKTASSLARPLLAKLLKESKIPVERRNAALALGHMSDDYLVDELILALKDSASTVRSGVVIALSNFRLDKSIIGLLQALEDKDTNVSHQAAQGLVKIGDVSIVPSLINLLQHKRPHTRINAAFVLGLLGDERAVNPLIQMLKNDVDDWVRAEGAATALGHLNYVQVVEPLIEALKDTNVGVRFFSCLSLGKLEATQALSVLYWLRDNDEGELRDGSETIKSAATSAINEIEQRNKSKISGLM